MTNSPHPTPPIGENPRRVGENPQQVRRVFQHAAPKYNLMNDVMSAGLHRLWKTELARIAAPAHITKPLIADLAGGSGDVAVRILKRRPHARVILIDPNPHMLALAPQNIHKILAAAETLPLQSNLFHSCTCAFGPRNFADRPKALRNILRILRPGGRFACLELVTPQNPPAAAVHSLLSQNIPKIAQLIVGNPDPYKYLINSIARFPTPQEFLNLVKSVGFARVRSRPLAGGAVMLLNARKL